MIIPTAYGYSLQIQDKSYMAQCLQGAGHETTESKLILSLLRPGDIAIDAGAHIGYFSRLMSKAGARVIAIEPNPMHAAFLLSNLGGCDAAIYYIAVSDSNVQEVPFYLPSKFDDGWGSLCASDQGQSRSIMVSTVRLDEIIKDQKINKPIRLLKIDVEGAEVPALRGLGDRLRDVEYILIECQDIASRVEVLGSTVEKINEILEGWKVRVPSAAWKDIPKAVSGGNYLFVNPNAS